MYIRPRLQLRFFLGGDLVADAGLEPATFGLWARRANRCSNLPFADAVASADTLGNRKEMCGNGESQHSSPEKQDRQSQDHCAKVVMIFPPAFMILFYHKYFRISLYFTVKFSGTVIFFKPAEWNL